MRYRLVFRRHGVSGGCPGQGGAGGGRGVVGGWSKGSASRNAKWLQSVEPQKGLGIALTLTIKEAVDPSAWRSALRAYTRFLHGLDRVVGWHFVVEWQARGVPHLHCMVYVDCNNSAWEWYMTHLRRVWVDISANAEMHAQYARAVSSSVGWLQYVAKHGARGLWHYQRSALPDGWGGASSGRMWGYGGDWGPKKEGQVNLSLKDFSRFSRVVRRYMISVGRSKKVVRNVIEAARGYPRGLMEWVPISVSLRVLAWVVEQPGSEVALVESVPLSAG